MIATRSRSPTTILALTTAAVLYVKIAECFLCDDADDDVDVHVDDVRQATPTKCRFKLGVTQLVLPQPIGLCGPHHQTGV